MNVPKDLTKISTLLLFHLSQKDDSKECDINLIHSLAAGLITDTSDETRMRQADDITSVAYVSLIDIGSPEAGSSNCGRVAWRS